jgi:hypothetical protein
MVEKQIDETKWLERMIRSPSLQQGEATTITRDAHRSLSGVGAVVILASARQRR